MRCDHACFATHQTIGRVKRQHPIHPRHADDDLAIARHRATGQPRATTGRHQRETVTARERDEIDDVLDAPRKHDRAGGDDEIARPIATVCGQIIAAEARVLSEALLQNFAQFSHEN